MKKVVKFSFTQQKIFWVLVFSIHIWYLAYPMDRSQETFLLENKANKGILLNEEISSRQKLGCAQLDLFKVSHYHLRTQLWLKTPQVILHYSGVKSKALY